MPKQQKLIADFDFTFTPCDKNLAWSHLMMPERLRYIADEQSVYLDDRVIQGADPESFLLLNETHSQDANTTYFLSRRIEQSKPSNFVVIDYQLAHNDSHLFLYGMEIFIPDLPKIAEVKSSIKLTNDYYLEINSRIFALWFDSFNSSYYANFLSDDLSHFTLLKDNIARDSETVFFAKGKFCAAEFSYSYHPAQFKPADISSFEVLSELYFKDNQCAYFSGEIIEDIDLASFKHVCGPVAADSKGLIYYGMRIPGSSPKGFRYLENPDVSDTQGHYAEDVGCIYYLEFDFTSDLHTCLPITRDKQGFSIIDRSYSKNHNQVFYKDQALPNSDPASFTILNYCFAKDINTVYKDGVPSSHHAPSFRLIDHNTAKDKNGRIKF